MADGPVVLDDDLNLPEPFKVSIGGHLIAFDYSRYSMSWFRRYMAWLGSSTQSLLELDTLLHDALAWCNEREDGSDVLGDLDPMYQSRVLSAFTTGRWGGASAVAAQQPQPSQQQAPESSTLTPTQTRNSRTSRKRRVA